MTITVALVLGLLVGASLGALGGGGSVLTVPALVYLLDQTPQAAITGSLIVVGLTAAAGTLPHAHAGHVAWTRGLLFGALGTGGSLAGSHLAAALDPDLLLVLFSLLMLTVAVLLLRQSERAAPRPVRGRPPAEHALAPPQAQPSRASGAATAARTGGGAPSTGPGAGPAARIPVTIDLACAARLALAATGVGLLTGFFGVGGGFLIVPALVLVLGMPMRAAVGTSLLVIAVNSATALAARSGSLTIDWGVILPFTAAAVLAAIGGGRLSARATPETLRRAFAVLLIAVSLAMATRSLLTLT